MAEDPHSRQPIKPKGILEAANDVIENLEPCEDSRTLTAKLQARYVRPPRYYPPKTHPVNKLERRIGDVQIGLSLPPLSPVQEERRNYKPSFCQYGIPRAPQYEPSRFYSENFDFSPSSTSMQQNPPAFEFRNPPLSSINMGRGVFTPEPFVYCSAYSPSNLPSSPLEPGVSQYPNSDRSCSFGDVSDMLKDVVPSPPLFQRRGRPPSPTRRSLGSDSERSRTLGEINDTVDTSRDLQSGQTSPALHPTRRSLCSSSDKNRSLGDVSNIDTSRCIVSSSPPKSGRAVHERRGRASSPGRRPTCLDSDRSCLLGDFTDIIEFPNTVPSHRQRCRQTSPERRDRRVPSPARMPPIPDSNRTSSFHDTNDVDFALSRDMGTSLDATPNSLRSISNGYPNVFATSSTPIPEDLSDGVLNEPLVELEHLELEEMRCIHEKMRSFQEARRELVLSIMSLQEVDVSL